MHMMTRREFLVKSGAVITAAAVAGVLGGAGKVMAGTRDPSGRSSGGKRPDPEKFTQPVMKAIALGINAPNSHNTQAWKFGILDDYEMRLYVDEKRLLPATDPPARQIHISAGCFLETMAQGATLFGCDAEVALFPEGYSSGADFGVRPVAKVTLKQTGRAPGPLAEFISRRQTSRGVYTGDMITDSEFQSFKTLSGDQYGELFFYNRDLGGFLDIFYEAFAIESRTYATNEETRRWFRFSEEQRKEKRDGLSVPQAGLGGLAKVFAEASLKHGDEKTWHGEKSVEGSLKNFKKGLESAKGIVTWKTKANGFEDWVRSGMDYAKFRLALTKMGFYAHPYNQVIQEYPEMNELRARFDSMMRVREPEKIQMIVRIGRGKTPYYSYRRNVDDFLIA
jgi:hypothetical protein